MCRNSSTNIYLVVKTYCLKSEVLASKRSHEVPAPKKMWNQNFWDCSVSIPFHPYTPPKFNSEFSPEKKKVGRRSPFLLGFGNFSGENSLLNFGRVSLALPTAPEQPTMHTESTLDACNATARAARTACFLEDVRAAARAMTPMPPGNANLGVLGVRYGCERCIYIYIYTVYIYI